MSTTFNAPGFAGMYALELLSRSPLTVDTAGLLREARALLGNVDQPEGDSREAHLFAAHDFPVAQEPKPVPALFAVLTGKDHTPGPETTADLAQSWAWPEAGEVVRACRHSLLFADTLGFALEPRVRHRFLQLALLATLPHVNAEAVYWRPTAQFLPPAQIIAALHPSSPTYDPSFGFINVRFYNIENSPGDMVMDTLGLAALGLTDFQIHFHDLEPGRVAGNLGSLGRYILENGDVIESGHTVAGLTPDEKWRCQTEKSLLQPERPVLDINPGQRYAAGQRH